jgi:hypothetical protein
VDWTTSPVRFHWQERSIDDDGAALDMSHHHSEIRKFSEIIAHTRLADTVLELPHLQ